MRVLKVSGVKVHSREKQPCGCVKSVRVKRHSQEKQLSGCVKSECQGLNDIAERNSPVGVLRVSVRG